MVIAIVDIKASLEKREELRRALSSLSGPTEAEAGCTSYQLYQEIPDTCVLRVISRWKAKSDLLRHIQSDTYKRLLLLMELGVEPPTIEFYTVSELRGLDLIKAARERSDRRSGIPRENDEEQAAPRAV
jgi:quinol monooxygenase YgiN